MGLMATVMLGLTALEGAALFEFQMSPTAADDVDRMAFCGILTPDRAAKALRGVAAGVFPSFMWDELDYEEDVHDLEDWIEDALGQDISDNGELSSEPEEFYETSRTVAQPGNAWFSFTDLSPYFSLGYHS